MKQTSFKQKFIGLFLITGILFGNLSVFTQTRRKTNSPVGTQTAGTQPKKEKKECAGGYSGTVSYMRTLTDSWTGKFGSNMNRKKIFQVNIPVRDDGGQTGSAQMSADGGISGTFNFKARATATLSDSDVTVQNTEGEEVCSFTIAGAKKSFKKCSSTTNRQSQATGEGDVTVYMRLNGNKFYISSDVPRINGQVNESSNSSCSSGCNTVKPTNNSRTLQITNDKQASFYTDEEKVMFNPSSFNRLSGSFTRTSSDGKTVETISWNLSRCAPPLQIDDIRFEQHRVPDPTAWHGVDPLKGTIDGNIVKIKAVITNNGGETVYPSVKFSETTTGEMLPDGNVSAAIKAGETRAVEYEWDTSGYAWDENKKAKMEREVKVELDDDAQTKQIKIMPKPVVMVHGLWANAGGWADYPIYLRNAHSYDWEGFAVSADPEHGKMNTGDFPGNWKPTNTIFQNSQELAKQIKYVRESRNAWHIDIVAHSMGGLISRHYINTFMQTVFDGKPEAIHLIMLGTPNQGSPCAYTVDGLFGMFGVTEMMAIKELRPYSVNKFNAINTNRKGVKFSILAGYTVRTTCHEWGLSDGVVQLPSAFYNISDRDYSRNIHTELTSKADFERFVLPRLAVGPKKAQAEKTVAWLENLREKEIAQANENDRYGFNQYFQKVSYKAERTQDDEPPQDYVTSRQKIVLAPKQTQEIEIPAGESGKDVGVLLVASTAVVATLTDSSGKILGKSEGGLEAVKNPFRTIIAEKSAANGALKLKLENFDTKEMTVFVAGFNVVGASSSFTIEAGKPSAAGIVPLTAKLTENNAPVLNAKITGKLVGQDAEIMFYDDGKHSDGAANDGVYGGTVEKLGKGEYFVEAKAETNNQTKMAVALITVGNSAAPTKRKGK